MSSKLKQGILNSDKIQENVRSKTKNDYLATLSQNPDNSDGVFGTLRNHVEAKQVRTFLL